MRAKPRIRLKPPRIREVVTLRPPGFVSDEDFLDAKHAVEKSSGFPVSGYAIVMVTANGWTHSKWRTYRNRMEVIGAMERAKHVMIQEDLEH